MIGRLLTYREMAGTFLDIHGQREDTPFIRQALGKVAECFGRGKCYQSPDLPQPYGSRAKLTRLDQEATHVVLHRTLINNE